MAYVPAPAFFSGRAAQRRESEGAEELRPFCSFNRVGQLDGGEAMNPRPFIRIAAAGLLATTLVGGAITPSLSATLPVSSLEQIAGPTPDPTGPMVGRLGLAGLWLGMAQT